MLLCTSCRPSPDSVEEPLEARTAPVRQQRVARARTANTSATRAAESTSTRKAAVEPSGRPQLSATAPPATPDTDPAAPISNPLQVPSTDEPAMAMLAPSFVAQARRPIDENRATSAGIRQLVGKHITLFTDLPSAPEIDELPHVFDLAVAPWCDYFRVNRKSAEAWQMRGFLMGRREQFTAIGLLPDDLPQFLHGYAHNGELWLNEQPSEYYRRHLLLHEGTHAFMQAFLHGMGPPWYAEGIAELMGTHRWENGKLQLRYFPQSRDDVPHWGRIKIVQTEYAAGRAMSIEQINDYSLSAHLRNEPYGWSWAAAAWLDGHPQFAERFRRLPRRVDDSSREFATFFRTQYRSDQRQLVEQWQLFVANLDYGYDIAREAIINEPTRSDEGTTVAVDIRADRGWQATGLIVSAGTTYSLTAAGRYQVAREPKIWWCEPGGVSIRYHQGHPLGMLLAGVSDQTKPLPGITPLAHPEPIGQARELQFATSGTLFLRINDSPAELADNAGQLRVEIRPVAP